MPKGVSTFEVEDEKGNKFRIQAPSNTDDTSLQMIAESEANRRNSKPPIVQNSPDLSSYKGVEGYPPGVSNDAAGAYAPMQRPSSRNQQGMDEMGGAVLGSGLYKAPIQSLLSYLGSLGGQKGAESLDLPPIAGSVVGGLAGGALGSPKIQNFYGGVNRGIQQLPPSKLGGAMGAGLGAIAGGELPGGHPYIGAGAGAMVGGEVGSKIPGIAANLPDLYQAGKSAARNQPLIGPRLPKPGFTPVYDAEFADYPKGQARPIQPQLENRIDARSQPPAQPMPGVPPKQIAENTEASRAGVEVPKDAEPKITTPKSVRDFAKAHGLSDEEAKNLFIQDGFRIKNIKKISQ